VLGSRSDKLGLSWVQIVSVRIDVDSICPSAQWSWGKIGQVIQRQMSSARVLLRAQRPCHYRVNDSVQRGDVTATMPVRNLAGHSL
jgi:hypothetical protein